MSRIEPCASRTQKMPFELQLVLGVNRVEGDEARRDRQQPGMPQQHGQHLRHGRGRIGGDADRPQMELANPWRHAAIPALTRDNFVKADRPDWHERRKIAAGDGENEIAEGLFRAEPAQFDVPPARRGSWRGARESVPAPSFRLRIPAARTEHRRAHA